MLFALASVNQWQRPAFGIDAEDILELIHAADRSAGKRDDFIILSQSSSKCVRRFQNRINEYDPVGSRSHRSSECRMVDDVTSAQLIHKMFDLID